MIEGDIEVDQIPDIWNEYYDRYLGISPPNRKLGVLQDIHWCMGAIDTSQLTHLEIYMQPNYWRVRE